MGDEVLWPRGHWAPIAVLDGWAVKYKNSVRRLVPVLEVDVRAYLRAVDRVERYEDVAIWDVPKGERVAWHKREVQAGLYARERRTRLEALLEEAG